tara:strand:+ start:2114 stop:2707 length:594 start_codon:yes stop_codon:yes gene_type:complete
MAKKQKDKSKIPPIIFQHNESGSFIMGEEEEGATRPRDIGLYAREGDCSLRLFKDGGFQLSGAEYKGDTDENKKAGSSITHKCTNSPLSIDSQGNIHITAPNGTITLTAQKINLKSEADKGTGINIHATSNVRISADRDFIVTGENITHDAKEKILSHSEGWNVLIAQCFRVHENLGKNNPPNMTAYIKDQIKTLKN